MVDVGIKPAGRVETSNPFLYRLRSLPYVEELEYRYTAVSLFAGGGGLDLGLAFAGFRFLFASDIEPAHCETVAHNLPDCTALPANIKDLSGDQIRALTGEDTFDLVAGGPPCQAFSILGRRGSFGDPRGQLVYEYARLLKELEPRAFLFENVPGLLTLHRGKDWKELLSYFEIETGYKLFYQTLNAANYGIPQVRQRVFVIGFRSDSADFEFPEPTHRNPKDLDNLLSHQLPYWLPSRLAFEDVDGLPNHRIRPHGERVRTRYSKVPPGTRDKVDHTDRVHPDRPSGTVLVGSRAGGGRPFIHPHEPRHISVREAARLQSFPDWYEFGGADTWQYRAVGNAVPPLLAEAVGKEIGVALEQL